jgi:signal peptidase II
VRVLLLSVAIVLGDQFSKLLVKGIGIPSLGISWPGLPYGTSRPVLGNLLRLTYIENPGMAFGIDVGGKPWFALFSVIASAAIVWYLHRMRSERLGFRVALAMILGGAVGNLIDRVFYGVLFDTAPLLYGRVVDFIDVDFFDITVWGYHISRWPVFNIADACVTLGVIMLLVYHRTAVAEESPRLDKPAAPPSPKR